MKNGVFPVFMSVKLLITSFHVYFIQINCAARWKMAFSEINPLFFVVGMCATSKGQAE